MKKFITILLITSQALTGFSQSVAINTTGIAANSSSIMDVSSTSKGVLVPRMTKAQKIAITTPATGLLLYQNAPDSIGFHYYDGTKWLWLAASNSIDTLAWKTTGNMGTNTANHYIGTKDNVPLSFRQNDKWLGRFDAGNKNYFIGANAGFNASSVNNIAIGDSTLAKTTTAAAYSNVAIGSKALFSNQVAHNVVAIGDSALLLSTYGLSAAAGNTAIGSKTLMSTINGAANTAVGYRALSNSQGDGNTAVGESSLLNIVNGGANTAVGSAALAYGNSGSSNTAIGYGAGSFVNADLNTYVGYSTGGFNANGSNTALGGNAMNNNSTGSKNTAIGVESDISNSLTITNSTVIGANSFVSQSNSLVLGSILGVNGGTASTNVGIGTTAPLTSLDVRGGIRTMYSGSNIQTVNPGLQIIPIPISPAVPAGWNFTNTMVIVSIVDGTTGTIYQTKLVSTNQINIDMNANFGGATRFNYIIFKL